MPVAPSFTSANNTTFTMGRPGTFTVIATEASDATLSETGTLPSGVTFNTANGILSGTPAAGTTGTYNDTFTATNSSGTATQTFTLTVDQAPVFTSTNSTTFTMGSIGTFTVTATGSPWPTLSETGTLPSGVTFTPAPASSAAPRRRYRRHLQRYLHRHQRAGTSPRRSRSR